MSILAAVANLIRALAAYWELKSKRYYHDIIEQSRSRIEALEDELTSLRNSGELDDAVAADRLRGRILSEKAHFKHLPNTIAATQRRDDGADG